MADVSHLKRLNDGVGSWNRWRKKHPEIRPDLIRADIGDLHLHGVDLHGADLYGANFFGARLFNANLMGADLRMVDFTGGTLANADLTHANLSGAILRSLRINNAKFVATNLTYAHIHAISERDGEGADFTNAEMSITTFDHVDLRAFKGLDTVRHDGPSSIGIDTIYESQGEIPEVFLRGCGVPDGFITFARSLVTQPVQFYSCFISYSHADKSFARYLYDTLQGRGIRCWLDEKHLLPGDDIYEGVDHGIRLSDKVLLCCSKASLTSWWVDNEIGKAFAKEQQLTRRDGQKVLALIPLNIDGHLFRWQDGKADEVRRRLAADFRGWRRNRPKFDRAADALMNALRSMGGTHKHAATRT
ncbi:MAG TPA: toll/interleukin-1 receptor domain-containing protein [Bryobacteraceae bacterium]|nr:toll/interleukin-1 receptor domain-containing protein [Bryobacteraceae bacterium]